MKTVTPIGEMLTSAGLISEGQVQTALYDQRFYENMRLGEILVSRGWLRQATADFFCDVLQRDDLDTSRFLLGESLLQAALLEPQHIQHILQEQRINHVRFGALAVLKGYISQKTLDFFLQQLYAVRANHNDYLQKNLRAAKETLNQNYKATRLQKDTLTEGIDLTSMATQTTTQAIAKTPVTDATDATDATDMDDIHWIT